MFKGIARKISVVAAGVTSVGWLLIVIGFGLETADNVNGFFGMPMYGSRYFPHWLVSLGGIPLIALAVARAVVSRAPLTKVLGTVTTFFSILFLLSLGMILYYAGFIINLSAYEVPHSIKLMFAGSLLATLCWTVLLMLWPFYENDESNDSEVSRLWPNENQ